MGLHVLKKIRQILKETLEENQEILAGSLGTFKGQSITLNLKDKTDLTPYHTIVYKIPVLQESLIKEELKRLEELDVIEKVDKLEWAAPVFTVPKKN